MLFEGIEFCCPKCSGDMKRGGEQLSCRECGALYPVVAGIPDLRTSPDPYIDFEEDRSKGVKLSKQLDALTFAELVDFYYKNTPVVPPHHARIYSRGLLAAEPRAASAFASWCKAAGPDHDWQHTKLLEVGCGTGPLLVAASHHCKNAVGVDIAFRWLVVARKRLQEAGCKATLICACAEALPFPDHSFQFVTADSVIEVVSDQASALAEMYRVLGNGGTFAGATPNRHSLGPDPHTGIWFGSWLPEHWSAAIAKRQGAIPPKRHLLSSEDLKRQLLDAGFAEPNISVPAIPAAQREHFNAPLRAAIDFYTLMRRSRIGSGLLKQIGPVLHVVAHKASP